MNKLATLLLAVILPIPTGFSLMSCSSDTPEKIENESEKDPSEGGHDIGGITIPKEVLEKVNSIYSKATLEPQTVTTVHELAILTSVCAARKVDGPISVTAARLNDEEITLVTIGGTEDKEGQATSMEESKLAAFGQPNDYLAAVTKLFTDGTISKEKPVLVTGISLGGMIAQQLLGQKEVLDGFQLRAVVTFGSPFTLPLDRQDVKVVRFADVNDKVPSMGEMMLRSGFVKVEGLSKSELVDRMNGLDKVEKITRTSKYTGMIETHALSYIEDACWDDVDFLGDSSKSHVLELTETMKFYPAPKLSK